MRVYIPREHLTFKKERDLSPLARPFYYSGEWQISVDNLRRWKVPGEWMLCGKIEDAEILLFPMDANYYYKNKWKWLAGLCKMAFDKGLYSFILVTGDYGEVFPDIPGLTYFRMGGFASQLSSNNKGFPVMLSDHLEIRYQTDDIAPVPWEEKPKIGFCGNASPSLIKAGKEYFKYIIENTRRFTKNPLRKDYEPLFASARERWKILCELEQSPLIETNFIYRDQYRGGARTVDELEKTTNEYYTNIRESAYVLCVRGAGNFSVRLFETLMMGRIPIFINTDCVLPLEDEIEWRKHVVWVEEINPDKIVEITLNFHNSFTEDGFAELQKSNRSIWLDQLNLGNYFNYMKKQALQ
jgi:hypothetical protein